MVTFTVTPEEFARMKQGDAISVKSGLDEPDPQTGRVSRRGIDFGRLNKKRLHSRKGGVLSLAPCFIQAGHR